MKKRISLLLLVLFALPLKAAEIDIYLVRHGKTLFNTTGQVQGWCDSPLTAQGIAQAQQTGARLQQVHFSAAFSSDAGRARETATLILQQNNAAPVPPLIELKALREWGYGGYEGRDDAELWQPLFAAAHVEFRKDWSTWEEFTHKVSDREMADAIARNDKAGLAENYDAIVARLQQGMEEIVRQTRSGNALVVSHGSAIATLLAIYVPEQYHGESIGNGSVTVLHYQDGRFTLKSIK